MRNTECVKLQGSREHAVTLQAGSARGGAEDGESDQTLTLESKLLSLILDPLVCDDVQGIAPMSHPYQT